MKKKNLMEFAMLELESAPDIEVESKEETVI